VRPSLIVLTPIVFDYDTRFRQRPQLLAVQTFITKPTVETLHKAILPGTAGVDVANLNPVLVQPTLDRMGNELRPIV
jgi:hypothetical protein